MSSVVVNLQLMNKIEEHLNSELQWQKEKREVLYCQDKWVRFVKFRFNLLLNTQPNDASCSLQLFHQMQTNKKLLKILSVDETILQQLSLPNGLKTL
jgi:hypothetical protein